MANPRQLDNRRKSIRNIRKITRTMELIATARFKKAMDRAAAATAYTDRITALVKDLSRAGLEVSHPLLEEHETTERAVLLVLTGNRGLCGGYNSNVIREGVARFRQLKAEVPRVTLEVSGKRGISSFRFRKIEPDRTFTNFEDRPAFAEVEVLANRYLDNYALGKLDRLDVAYTSFHNVARQTAVVETLLPLGSIGGADTTASGETEGPSPYEFLPSAESILEEVVPSSFRVRLFKCFLDSAVSEQVARMVAMKAATDAADDMIRDLSMTYNRARQGRITSELLDVIGGVEALST
ncbi:MAG: ATP synthase F1 subunit gamma [Planctomycetales bacterium]|nr:ATP synthase F1 subunit gamma [Planctomycetales bacterium]